MLPYPRSDVRYLPRSMASDAADRDRDAASQAIRPLGCRRRNAVIRTGKTGTFSDAGLKGEPHHAIIPNINKISELSNILSSTLRNKLFSARSRAASSPLPAQTTSTTKPICRWT